MWIMIRFTFDPCKTALQMYFRTLYLHILDTNGNVYASIIDCFGKTFLTIFSKVDSLIDINCRVFFKYVNIN